MLSTLTNAAGGYLESPAFKTDVMNYVITNTPFLSLAQTFPTKKAETYFHQVTTPYSGLLWMDEGEQKPELTDMAISRKTMRMSKIAGVAVISDEALYRANEVDPNFLSLIKTEIGNALKVKVNDALFNSIQDTNYTGIDGMLRQGCYSTIASGSISGTTDIADEILAAIYEVQRQGYEPNAIVCDASVLYGLRALRTSSEDIPKYPSVMGASPMLWGLPVITMTSDSALNVDRSTTSGAVSDVIVADWRQVFVGMGGLDFRLSDTAYVGSKSMFESDTTAVRVVQHISSPLIRDCNSGVVITNMDVVIPWAT